MEIPSASAESSEAGKATMENSSAELKEVKPLWRTHLLSSSR